MTEADWTGPVVAVPTVSVSLTLTGQAPPATQEVLGNDSGPLAEVALPTLTTVATVTPVAGVAGEAGLRLIVPLRWSPLRSRLAEQVRVRTSAGWRTWLVHVAGAGTPALGMPPELVNDHAVHVTAPRLRCPVEKDPGDCVAEALQNANDP